MRPLTRVVAVKDRQFDFPRTVILALQNLNDATGIRHGFCLQRVVQPLIGPVWAQSLGTSGEIAHIICGQLFPLSALAVAVMTNTMSAKDHLPLATKARGKNGKWTVHVAAYSVVRNMRANGCSQATIAAALGMPANTFRDVLERDDVLRNIYDEGNAAMHDELVGILMQQAREGYAPAAMFLLKASHGYRENAPVQATDKQTVNILIPPAASAAELMKLTAAMKDITPPDPESAIMKETA